MDKLLKPIISSKSLKPGTIIRRIGSGKDQQGSFIQYDEHDDLNLVNIIDMKTGTLVANEGVLKPHEGDKLFYYASSFNDSPVSQKALKIVKNWPLYKQHEELQDKIINFIKITYIPEQIIDMAEQDSLHLLFVPVQQKFRIGRFTEMRSPERICNDLFMLWLESLNRGSHVTYLARITQQKGDVPRFYSAGTRSHGETAKLLEGEIYKFDPTHGGHIRAAGIEDGKKQFLIDAGSKYMGLGVKSPLEISELVADALHALYPEFGFTPLAGRGAAGD
jgi:hypothetical protein